jgi:hypothetical protein
MVIEYDKTTLPENFQTVKFYLIIAPEQEFVGRYIDKNKMFFVDPFCWFYAHEVIRWEEQK